MEICIARTVSRIHRCKCVFVCFEHFNTCLECVLVDSWQSHVSLARSSKSSHYRLTASECISRFGIGFQPCAPATNHTQNITSIDALLFAYIWMDEKYQYTTKFGGDFANCIYPLAYSIQICCFHIRRNRQNVMLRRAHVFNQILWQTTKNMNLAHRGYSLHFVCAPEQTHIAHYSSMLSEKLWSLLMNESKAELHWFPTAINRSSESSFLHYLYAHEYISFEFKWNIFQLDCPFVFRFYFHVLTQLHAHKHLVLSSNSEILGL